jgi:hypothetical protein
MKKLPKSILARNVKKSNNKLHPSVIPKLLLGNPSSGAIVLVILSESSELTP